MLPTRALVNSAVHDEIDMTNRLTGMNQRPLVVPHQVEPDRDSSRAAGRLAAVFARSFAEVSFDSEALGSNLLGAVAGGVLESISFWTGLRALLLVSVLLYALSALTLKSRHHGSAISDLSHELN
jgi:hypothetical protein